MLVLASTTLFIYEVKPFPFFGQLIIISRRIIVLKHPLRSLEALSRYNGYITPAWNLNMKLFLQSIQKVWVNPFSL